MSTRKVQREKDIQNVRALLKKIERGGENIQTLLWRLMDEFDNDYEEKNEYKIDNDKPSLLMADAARYMCNKGHTLYPNYKHLGNEACIGCGHTNTENKPYQPQQTNQQLQSFLSSYNISAIPYGPTEQQKKSANYKTWISRGFDKKWPLHFAAITGNIKQVQKICKMNNIDVNQTMSGWYDKTPVGCATYYGHLPILIELIKYGANATPPPDKTSMTPYSDSTVSHQAIVVFYEKYMNFACNININDKMNRQCHMCYMFDSYFNRNNSDNMSNYVYCVQCGEKNIDKLNMKKENNDIISKRIIKTLQKHPEISVDTLCQMKDVKAMNGLLQEIIASGKSYDYTLWLIDIDNFKSINSALTHAIADTKLQALGNILKRFEEKTKQYWLQKGLDGIWKIWAFRQGGDEFAMIVWGNYWKRQQQQAVYDTLVEEVHQIRVENMENMRHITVSIGACIGQAIKDCSIMIKRADEMAEMVKKEGKNGIKVYCTNKRPFIFKSFTDIK